MTTPHFLIHLAELGATDLHPLRRQATAALMQALAMRPGQRLLEVGCGAGGTMVRVGLRQPVQIDGVDALLPMLRVARQRLRLAGLQKRTSLSHATAAALPFAAQTYDRVYTESVLGFQNMADAQAMLAHIFRVLKKGGLYVANEAIWKQGVAPERVAAIYAACIADFGICQASEQPWNLDDWLNLARSIGFTVVDAGLLEDRLGPPVADPLPWRQRLADGLTWFYRARGRLSPRVRRQQAAYRRRLEAHREDGRYMESRLFVLARP